jgi:hypothetical protein
MAELNVQKKKKSPIGWIILGVVIIGLIIWIAASDNNGIDQRAQYGQERQQTSEYGQEQSQAVVPFGNDDRDRASFDPRVQEFLNFADEFDNSDMNAVNAREGIVKLSDALIAIAQANNDQQGAWQGELEKLKQEANQLQDANMSNQHATVISGAFSSAANVIQNIQNRYYPDLESEASDVMDAAQDIEAQEPISEQESEIKSFFDESADVVKKMEERKQTSLNQR